MALTDKKVLMVVAPTEFDAAEFETTRKIREGRGLQVKVASTNLGAARAASGLMVRPDVSLDDVKTWEYDAVIFVGGRAPGGSSTSRRPPSWPRTASTRCSALWAWPRGYWQTAAS